MRRIFYAVLAGVAATLVFVAGPANAITRAQCEGSGGMVVPCATAPINKCSNQVAPYKLICITSDPIYRGMEVIEFSNRTQEVR